MNKKLQNVSADSSSFNIYDDPKQENSDAELVLTISYTENYDGYWLKRPEGEGMQVSFNKLASALLDFYNKEF